MEKLKRILKNEEGNVLILFAGSFILISFFIGLIIDINMIYMDNNYLQNLLQIVREERFVHQEVIRYSENPGKETYEIVHETAKKNGFNGDLKVYFKEEKPDIYNSFRSYKVRVVLSIKSDFYFGKLFKLKPIILSAKLDGGESYGDGLTDVIWHPSKDISEYNGIYSGNMEMDSSDPKYNSFEKDTLPGGW